MSFLYVLEGIRNPVMNFLMGILTHLGEETIFIVMVLLMYWCIDKKRGLYILFVGFLGMEINTFLKMTFRIPRPWVLDPNFTIVESARAQATGYSFPSGHTQIITGTMGSIARTSKNRGTRIGCIVLIAIVSFSRMYLGCHTPMDVFTSLVIGTVLVLAIYKFLFSAANDAFIMGIMFLILFISAITTLIYVLSMDPSIIDAANFNDALNITVLLLGLLPALVIGWYVDRKYIQFTTNAPITVQIRKMLLGIAIVFAIYGGLKVLFEAVVPVEYQLITRGIRYFLMLIFAMVIWPLTFPKEKKEQL